MTYVKHHKHVIYYIHIFADDSCKFSSGQNEIQLNEMVNLEHYLSGLQEIYRV